MTLGGLTGMISDLIGNIGQTWETTVLLILTIGSLFFFTRDFRIGSILSLMVFSVVFIFFELFNMPTTRALIMVFVFIAVLTLSLYIGYSKKNTVGFV